MSQDVTAKIRLEAYAIAAALDRGELGEMIRVATCDKVLAEQDMIELNGHISDRTKARTAAFKASMEEHQRILPELKQVHDARVEELMVLRPAIRGRLDRAEAKIRSVIARCAELKKDRNAEEFAVEQRARKLLESEGSKILQAAGALGTGLQPITVVRSGIKRGAHEEPGSKGHDELTFGLVSTGADVMLRLMNDGKLTMDAVKAARRWGRLADQVFVGVRTSAMRFTDAPGGEGGNGADPVEIRERYDNATSVLDRRERAVLDEVVRFGTGLAEAGQAVAGSGTQRHRAAGIAEAWAISGAEALLDYFADGKQKRARSA